MSKFKIGDKVKILSTDVVNGISNHGVRVGMIGKVVHVYECGLMLNIQILSVVCGRFMTTI